MKLYLIDSLLIVVAGILVFLNGFFVATEFALVRIRAGRLESLVEQNRRFAKTARWLFDRLTASLSVCQLGITMASLGLGWLGEPALADLLRPMLQLFGVTSAAVVHSVAFAIAFTIITAAHIVLGEQAPKIYAIRRAETVLLASAVPLKVFYLVSYPFMILLNSASNVLLRWVGIEGTGHEDSAHSEEEIRALLSQSHAKGELTRSEHRLLNAVFEFDDQVCRQIMVPRGDIEIFDLEQPFPVNLELAKRTKHTRFPLCRGSLDHAIGVVHVKDLVGVPPLEPFDLTTVARPPHKVPDSMRISRLLQLFQRTRQHLALVLDEYGTTVGMVTMENVLEQIVGPMQDEFDSETPSIVPDGGGQFIVLGNTGLDRINTELGINLQGEDADTLSGLLVEHLGRTLRAGDRVDLENIVAEVLEVHGERATRVRLRLTGVNTTLGAKSS